MSKKRDVLLLCQFFYPEYNHRTERIVTHVQLHHRIGDPCPLEKEPEDGRHQKSMDRKIQQEQHGLQPAHLVLKLQIRSFRSVFVHCSLTFFCS